MHLEVSHGMCCTHNSDLMLRVTAKHLFKENVTSSHCFFFFLCLVHIDGKGLRAGAVPLCGLIQQLA